MTATTAQEFYETKTYNSAKNPSKLDDAFKWLGKAVAFETMGEAGAMKIGMALKAAIKAEAEALGHEPDLTNIAA